MTDCNGRIKLLCKTLNLSQDTFGEKLGIRESAVSKIENGKNGLKNQLARLICRTFNADYFWLAEGADVDMFMASPETTIDEVVEEFDLNADDRALIETYLEASHEERRVLLNFLQMFAKKIQKDGE